MSNRINWSQVKRNDAIRHNEQYVKDKAEKEKREREQTRVNEFIAGCDRVNPDDFVQIEYTTTQDIQKRGRSHRSKIEGEPKVILIDGAEYGRMQARELIQSFKDELEPKVTNDFTANQVHRNSTYPKRYLERT